MPEQLATEVKKTKKHRIKWFIGVDVSKNTLDYAVINEDELLFHEQRQNTKKSVGEFVERLKQIPKFRMAGSVFCLESTGIYGNNLLETIYKKNGRVAQMNALMIKRFMGVVRGKTDKADAIKIATYAKKNLDGLLFWAPPRLEIIRLKALLALRERLMVTGIALSTPLKELESFVSRANLLDQVNLCKKSIRALNDDLENIESRMDQVVKNDENLRRLLRLITSVPGVGRITAIQLMICTNEFKSMNCPKKFACYAGVVPFRVESGLVIKKARLSPISNRKMKTLLHMCAISARNHDPELKAYYDKKTNAEGKAKMVVINAIRNKLIARIFACVNQNRKYTVFSTDEKKQRVN